MVARRLACHGRDEPCAIAEPGCRGSAHLRRYAAEGLKTSRDEPLRSPLRLARRTEHTPPGPTSSNMSDDHGATRETDRTSQELDAVRAMVAEMRRDIAALRAELGPDAAPMHVAPWPTAASAYASIPTVPRV